MARQAIKDPAVFGLSWPMFGAAAVASTLLTTVVRRLVTNRRVWITSHLVMALGVAILDRAAKKQGQGDQPNPNVPELPALGGLLTPQEIRGLRTGSPPDAFTVTSSPPTQATCTVSAVAS